jgi:tetratricopeptide (TPR) repeat protein
VTFSTKKIAIVCMAMMAFAAAQTPPAAQPKPFKDDNEAALAVAANNEKDPKAQIEKLDKWKHDYPETAYDAERLNLYFQAYGATKQFHEQIGIAQELLKKYPDSLIALRSILVAFPQISSPTDDDRKAASDAARNIIDRADQVFAPEKAKENGFTDAQWKDLKPQMIDYAKVQYDKIVTDQGMDAVIAAIKADPTRVTLNAWVGKQILDDVRAHPDHAANQGDAIFHYARAAAYAGPGCLDPKQRAGMKSFVDRAYKTFHGSMDGEDKLLEVAATQPLPGDFKIESNLDIIRKTNAADADWRQAHPMLAAWRDTKAILVADDGQAKFDAEIKDSALPKFTGKIVSMTPAIGRPKSIVLLVDDEKDGKADCTLLFETALPGKMEAGETLSFEGVAKSFVKDPYMLTVTVAKDKLEGWTGKNAPAGRGAAPKTTKKGN